MRREVYTHGGHLRCSFDDLYFRVVQIFLTSKGHDYGSSDLSINVDRGNVFQTMCRAAEQELITALLAVPDLRWQHLKPFLKFQPVEKIAVQFAAIIETATDDSYIFKFGNQHTHFCVHRMPQCAGDPTRDLFRMYRKEKTPPQVGDKP